jgi:hypothetical protein
MPTEAAKLIERSRVLQQQLERLSKELSDLQRQVSQHLLELRDDEKATGSRSGKR